MKQRFIDWVYKSLSMDVTPLAYLTAIHSLIFGAAFLLFSDSASVQATLLYQAGALVGVPVWGALVTFSAITLILGLETKHTGATILGGTGLFTAWVFGILTYAFASLWLQMALGIVTALYFGYPVLAASIGHLWNYAPSREDS